MSVSLIILLWTCSYVAFLHFAVTTSGFRELTIGDFLAAFLASPLALPALALKWLLAAAVSIVKKLENVTDIVVWRRK